MQPTDDQPASAPGTPPDVRLTEETIAYLQERMRHAVRDGIAEALTSESARTFFSTGIAVLREEAAMHTGKFVLDGIWKGAKSLMWIAVFVAAVYSIGGWSLIKTIAAAVYQAGSK